MKNKFLPNPIYLLFIIIGLASLTIHGTNAYFSDQVVVSGNNLSTGHWVKPTVDIKAENSDGPLSIDKNTNITLSWTSADADTCVATGDWTGAKPHNGSEIINDLEVDQEFILTCENLSGPTSDSVTVNINVPPPAILKVVINEVYYDVKNDGTKGTEALNEWIELFNAGDIAANLKGWTLTDNSGNAKTLSLADLTLSPQQFAIIAKNIASFLSYWPGTPASTLMIEIPDNNALLNDGDRLILKNENNEVVDQMSYGTDTTVLTPAVPDVPEGQSIERNPDGQDTDPATAADFVPNPTPTPGL